MPTAARLAAAILFAVLLWLAAELALPAFPLAEQAEPRWFAPINAGAGLILGWRILGTRSGGQSWAGAVGQGLTTLAAALIVGLFLSAAVRMVELSLRRIYDGPAEAVVAVFALMAEIGRTAALPHVLALLVAGAAVAGILAEWVGRHFR
ncbi:MAG: TrgA family protein [Rubellimicrobium sp.]|nr:TrgA family protein [Rubellimicrobium sp.]